MNPQVKQFLDMIAKGPDHFGAARAHSKQCVTLFPQWFTGFHGLTIPELVQQVDADRADGNEYHRALTDIWLMATFAPQHITLRKDF